MNGLFRLLILTEKPIKYKINERVKVKSLSLKEANREVKVNTPFSACNEMALR